MKFRVIVLVTTIIVLVFALIGSLIYMNNQKSGSELSERIRKETQNYTMCEMGDIVGEDIETLNYKDYNIDYHGSDFSQSQIQQFADACLGEGVKDSYQMDCCVRYKMYP